MGQYHDRKETGITVTHVAGEYKMSNDFKKEYEKELARRRIAEEKLQKLKDAIWFLIEDDLYEHFEPVMK